MREEIYDEESEKKHCEWGNARNGKRRLKSMNARCERQKRRKCVMRNALWPKRKMPNPSIDVFLTLDFFQIHFRKHESEQCWLERSRVHSIAYFISMSSSSQFIYIVTDSQKPAKIWKTFSRSKLLLRVVYSIDSRYFYWIFFATLLPFFSRYKCTVQ